MAVDFDNVNIFFTHLNPTIAAEFCCDAHVRKMVVESTQMCANAYHMDGSKAAPPPKIDGVPYLKAHWDHPCAKWAREDFKQWNWLLMHAWGLAKEYEMRFGSKHGCEKALSYMNANLPMWLPNKAFYDPPLCMPDEFKSRIASTVASYRNYIRRGKTNLHNWTKRPPPTWLYADGNSDALKDAAERLLDACELSCFDADDYRDELGCSLALMTDDEWNDAVEQANRQANGHDPDGSQATRELAEQIFNKSTLQLLAADQQKQNVAPSATAAEWQLVKWVATEFANGRDPLAHPPSGNYSQARL